MPPTITHWHLNDPTIEKEVDFQAQGDESFPMIYNLLRFGSADTIT